MRRSIIPFALLSLLVACQGTKTSDTFKLTATVGGEVSGKVYLQVYKDKVYTTIDSVEIANHQVTFTGSVEEPLVYALRSQEVGRAVQIFLDNSAVTVHIDSTWQAARVDGSVSAVLFERLSAANHNEELNVDSVLTAIPTSPVAAYFLFRNGYQYDYDELKALRSKVDASLSANTYIVAIDQLIIQLERVKIGAIAPNFTLQSSLGDSLSLTSLRGKYVLIDFWASWCPDCRRENPELVKIYNQFKGKNFTILGVSLDRNRESWLAAIEKDGLVWPQVLSQGAWQAEVTKTYGIRWVPTAILISPQGVILYRGLKSEALVGKLKELLAI